MSGKLFWYSRKEPSPIQVEGKEQKFVTYKDGINIDTIIRAISLDDGRMIILLNDIHQRPQEVPMKNKQGKITGYKREMNVFQSEIYLTEPEDIANFKELTT